MSEQRGASEPGAGALPSDEAARAAVEAARGVGEAMRGLGWRPALGEALRGLGAVAGEVGRVRSQHRGGYEVETEAGVRLAAVPGKTMRGWQGAELPMVGDWVLVEVPPSGWSVVRAILPRWSRLARRAAGSETEEQGLVANVDVALVVTGLDGDLNLRRLERYAMMCHEGGVPMVVALSKIDLVDDPAAAVAQVQAGLPGVEVLTLSVPRGLGVEAVRGRLGPGVTMVMVGSSGVGKSTLLNELIGRDAEATNGVRWDGRGRHTTTRRHLLAVPGGGVIIDTPGMRELGVLADEQSIDEYAELEGLIGGCRYSDCQHGNEPGCVIQAAVAAGEVTRERLATYLALRAEAARVEHERSSRSRADERAQGRRMTRALRSSQRLKGR